MKETILKELEKMKEELWNISEYIYKNPELGNREFKAVEKLTDFLRNNSFKVEIGIVNKPTAFKASYKSGKEGPNIAFICEYDALPQIGHGCGHNMIGTMGVGAAVALSKVLNCLGGQITVLGTPAEETDGAKVDLVDKGEFDGIDVAMMVHPEGSTYESGSSLAMDAIQFDFTGKASHAASSPEEGINALDAVILTFNGINALRQHVPSDTRIHGIIKEGGVAANIVPDKAIAQFYVRSSTRKKLDLIVEKIKNIAKGAELMTGASLEISNYEISYDNMNTNGILSEAFAENLRYIGVKDILPAKAEYGSADMGNVSKVVPAIHPYIGIGCPNVAGHTKEFAYNTVTENGREALIQGAAAMALTGYDVIIDNKLLKQIKEEFIRVQ
ncbi:M20 family metallopeptidase [Clostridiaceae bacterium UIB06]|uniref:Peptidase M20 domain-containing protein 2 n=2 Tax=Clostridium thailandense TaxID=2794346 RepID=A0A949U0Y6_9CLOT|nr:M20 family metallopeptidase [Clostridium thailandense]MCH5136159.1 M20 family metallopeptidase [Clostridiaceae bacterium UIB06]